MKIPIREWTVEAPWGNLSLTSWGNPDGLPVFLVHGRQDCAATFQPVLQLLPKDDYYYVGINMPGSGASDHLPIVKNSAIKFVALEPNSTALQLDLLPKCEPVSENKNFDLYKIGTSQSFDDVGSAVPSNSPQDVDDENMAKLGAMADGIEITSKLLEKMIIPSEAPKCDQSQYQNDSDDIKCNDHGEGGSCPFAADKPVRYDPRKKSKAPIEAGTNPLMPHVELSSDDEPDVLPKLRVDLSDLKPLEDDSEETNTGNNMSNDDAMPDGAMANGQNQYHRGSQYRRESRNCKGNSSQKRAESGFCFLMSGFYENRSPMDWIPNCFKCCLPCTNRQKPPVTTIEILVPAPQLRRSWTLPIVQPLYGFGGGTPAEIELNFQIGRRYQEQYDFLPPNIVFYAEDSTELPRRQWPFFRRRHVAEMNRDVHLINQVTHHTATFEPPRPTGTDENGHRRVNRLSSLAGRDPDIGVKIMRFHFLGAMEIALEHLGWDKFIFIGHSMGCEIGLFYNAIYPGRITKMIFFDAEPTLRRLQVQDLALYQKTFYDNYYNNYDRENYHYKTYTIPQATQALMKARNLTEEKASIIVSKSLIHVKDDQYKFTWGHRLKLPAPQNYPNSYYFALFSNIPPTILISASESLKANAKYSAGALELIAMMETLKNFTHVTVEGDHDVHLSHPDRVAPYVSDFLTKKNTICSKL